MNSSSIIDFFVTNWYNVLSLVLSLFALVVAIQANIYARKNSSPTLSIKDDQERTGGKSVTYWRIKTAGCYRKSIDAYEIVLRVLGEYWITNSGGIDSTLVDISFVSSYDSYLDDRFNFRWYVEMNKRTNPNTKGDLIFDLNIPSGATMPVYVTAISRPLRFQTKEAALKFADDVVHGFAIFRTCRWYFRFGDGTTLVRRSREVRFSSDSPLEYSLDIPCNE